MKRSRNSGLEAVTRRTTFLLISLGVAASACVDGSVVTRDPTISESAPPSVAVGAASTPFPNSTEPLAIEPGTYRIPESAWSVADFTVTFPEGWTAQYGHVYARNPDADDELGFYAVVVNDIYADACDGTAGALMDIGPSVDDLAAALLQQPGPEASGPADTTIGGYAGVRIDLEVPQGLDLRACNLEGIGLQVWYSQPADKYFVLLPDGIASVYILDVDGQRQVFLTQHGSGASDEDRSELESVLHSVRFEE